MSFIGPRAEWDELVSTYETLIPYDHLRNIFRPGLTGWAQVRYPDGSSVEDARMKLEYDLYDITNQSPMLDLMIVLRTIRVVLFGVGSR
ncbi:MAG: sugar transferase [Planctomycetes bacterium]|nr:sugar transferase [Planctomycetota bacterium]